jgi:hypothetical protein
MLLEINVGLLGAVAIIASLLNMNMWGTRSELEERNKTMRAIICGFGISALLSATTLILMVSASFQGLPTEGPITFVFTTASLGSFVLSTEVLAAISIARFGSNESSKPRKK